MRQEWRWKVTVGGGNEWTGGRTNDRKTNTITHTTRDAGLLRAVLPPWGRNHSQVQRVGQQRMKTVYSEGQQLCRDIWSMKTQKAMS